MIVLYRVLQWSSPVARQAHNLKVAGSNPAAATNLRPWKPISGPFLLDCSHFARFRPRPLKQGELAETRRTKTNTSTNTSPQQPFRLVLKG
jgi:hypothetical protein